MDAIVAAPATLSAWLAYQETLNPRAIVPGLDRTRRVADALGLLADKTPTITVGGTNGKGSSVALLASIHRAAGRRVGAYTSPHLLRYNERIAIDGLDADDEALCAAFEEIESARLSLGGVQLTYFEFGTLAALYLFKQARVDVRILEVGLGGRLDSVNVIDADAALVTNIGLDHQDWLGPDRESIAFEKAGIFRAQRPAVIADPEPPAALLAQAARVQASPILFHRDYDFRVSTDGSWTMSGGPVGSSDALPAPTLAGAHQYRNAAGALALIQAMQQQLPVADSAIHAGLKGMRLRGRFERIGEAIFDVGHNAEAAEALAVQLAAAGMSGRVRLVLGMLRDKPVEAVARLLAPQVLKTYFGGLRGERGLSAVQLAARAQDLRGQTFTSIAEAYRQARQERLPGEFVVVCGSFLTVAEALNTDDLR